MVVKGARTEPYDAVFLVGRRLRARSIVPSVAERLTNRELEILQLLAEGLAQAQIAEQLVISPKTVGSHIEHILAKLGVRSRAQAVAVAYREELVEPV